MDATLMFSAPAQPQATPNAAAAVAVPAGAVNPTGGTEQPQSNTPNGRIFAGLMRGLLPTHERQDVAADTTADATDLKSEALGAQLEVITATSDQPDASSLAAFARAQGLDESAVKALFGEKLKITLPASGSDTAVALTAAMAQVMGSPEASPPVIAEAASAPLVSAGLPVPGDLPHDVAWLARHLSAEISLSVTTAKTENTSTSTTDGLDATTLTTASWLASQAIPLIPSNTVPVSTDATLGVISESAIGSLTSRAIGSAPLSALPGEFPALPGTTKALLAAATTTPAPAPAPALPTAIASVPLSTLPTVPVLLPTPSPKSTTALTQTSTTANAVDGLAPAMPTPQDAMRIRLVPAWAQVTQQLTQMSGTSLTAAWGALTAATLGGPIRSVALDLSSATASVADAAEEALLSGADNNGSGASADLNRAANVLPLPTAAQPLPGTAQTLRHEQYQQLADRLGQAMAERLQSQIARGEWKLQMRLNPANLGRIDVELDMHTKGLDAMFRSDNPLTRELMAQSMPKLKDTLTQSGMAVASVWVNSDAGRQSDGNPTPQKESSSSAENMPSVKADTPALVVTKTKRTPDGFDVLA